MAAFLYRVGAFGARRRWAVGVGWLLILGALVGLAGLFPGSFQSSGSIPGSPAQTALERMNQHWPAADAQTARIVFQAPSGHKLGEPALERAVASSLAAARQVDGVTAVTDPAQSGTVSSDGRTEFVDVQFSTASDERVPPATLTALRNAAKPAQQAHVEAVFGGKAFVPATELIGIPEIVGIMVTLAVLVITFGSLLSAGMPLFTALLGVGASLAGIVAVASFADISDNAPTLAMMLGLAVGIDYALLIVSRHRSQLASGMAVEESVATATATAGSAVLFAGATVLIALAGLSVAGVPILTSMGLASAGAVAVAVVMALTLLPALLAAAGTRLVPQPGSRATRQAADPARPTLGTKWVDGVVRRPVRVLVVVTTGLLVLAAPALGMKTALTDNGSFAETASVRQAYDMVADAFGPGANGPLIVLVENKDASVTATTAKSVHTELSRLKGVAAVTAVDTAKDGTAARIQVIPSTSPRDQATTDLVTRLHTTTEPLARSSGSYIAVTGQTAVSIDVATKLSGALAPFALVVVGLSLLLLLLAFRSLAVPVKATAGFLLSLGAAFGATVVVFQGGFLSHLLGVPREGPVASFMPIIVMAVLFGLAMDYEVFLVSAISEDYRHHRDARQAIVSGARRSSRVVTSAALIMISVFTGFLFSHDPNIMPIAFTLALGVLIDAFLVRMTLVPAVMALLGDRAWWIPGWLDRILPHVDIEGESLRRVDIEGESLRGAVTPPPADAGTVAPIHGAGGRVAR
ncbi:MMPL family transporter [Streptomyces sp. NPDC048179]|uniref:MMPL family transporter n=1 Tax=Streptomyces sp. NPDC048179 TaxID=3365506 RepID=UPI00370F9FF4